MRVIVISLSWNFHLSFSEKVHTCRPFFFDFNVNGGSYLDMINVFVVDELSNFFHHNVFDEVRLDEEI